jgi:hypothetical protein
MFELIGVISLVSLFLFSASFVVIPLVLCIFSAIMNYIKEPEKNHTSLITLSVILNLVGECYNYVDLRKEGM